MTEQHAEGQAGHQAEALGLKGLSERERVIGIRFFAAARTGSPEAARNILTQDLKPTDKKVRIEGVYNPILEGISIAKRKDYWEKEGSPYEVALEKWRNRFTTVINQVADPTRIAAFKSILPDDPALKNKALSEINHNDATTLFKEYSENKSDIDLFMKRAITNLTAQGVLHPDALQAHIAHLRWIGTGFFGKETASIIGTQILFETERQKDPIVISEFIDENLDRVNNFGPEEAEVLRVVRQQAILWEEEKKKQPVGATPTVQPAQPVIGVTPDDDELFPGPVAPQSNNPIPPPVAEGTQVAEGQPTADVTPVGIQEPNEQSASGVVENNPTRPPERPQGLNKENVIVLGTDKKVDLMEQLNTHLENETSTHVAAIVPPDKLMEYMISAFAEGKKVEVGRLEVSGDDKITISRVKISQPGGNVTLNNITISNNPNAPGVSATVGKIDKSILAKAFAGDVEQKISAINDFFLTELKKRIASHNPSWAPKSLSISKGMIIVGFEKSAGSKNGLRSGLKKL